VRTKGLILGVSAALWGLSLTAQANYKCDQIIKKTGFEICYNYQLKAPLWSKATLTAQDLRKKGYSRKGIRFYEERSIPRRYRATSADYRHSGWDRGHEISNDDMNHNLQAQKDTFSLANITPQAPKLNRGVYRKAEKATRSLIIRSRDRGTIIAGAIFDRINPKRIGPSRIAVPKEIYRIVKLRNGKTYAYLFPNKKGMRYGKIKQYRVPVSVIKKKTGFKF